MELTMFVLTVLALICSVCLVKVQPRSMPQHGTVTAFVGRVAPNHPSPLIFGGAKSRIRRFSGRRESVTETQPQELSPLSRGGLFDSEMWEEYKTSLQWVIENNKVIRREMDHDVDSVVSCLSTNKAIVPISVHPTQFNGENSGSFKEVVRAQQALFFNRTKFTKEQYDFAIKTLTYLGDYSAKRRLSNTIAIAWHKMLESGMIPRENCISTYLYVAGLDETANLTGQIAAFHDLLYKPNEKTVTLRIKSMVAKQDARGARQILNSLQDSGLRRLRTFVPILELYCSFGDILSALTLYREMQMEPGVVFEPGTYSFLIGALAKNGCFRKDSDPISGIDKLGFYVSHGPELFDQLCQEMADDVLDLNEECVKIICDGFLQGFNQINESQKLLPFEEMTVCNDLAQDGEFVLGRVSVNEKTAICPRTKVKLRLLRLEESQRQQVHDTLVVMAGKEYAEYSIKLQNRRKNNMKAAKAGEDKGSQFAEEEIERFSRWLDERDGEAFTAVVDGPNIAYFGRGIFDYRLIEMVVDYLEEMGERPLVVVGAKYMASTFHTSRRIMQTLTEEAIRIRDRLIHEGKMYVVAKKCLDDYYWMLASVSDQANSRNGTSIRVSTRDDNGRFPGLRPMLITNDKMRDHRLQLLEERLFRRWTSCHIVNYNLTFFEKEEEIVKDIDLFAADFFSREIQGNPSPDDSNTTVWHFPVSEWDEHDRLCIRIP